MYRATPRPLVVSISPSLTWAVTRCLARAGMPPVVLGWHRTTPLAWVNDCARYVPLEGTRWIDGELDPALIEQIERTARAHGLDVVIPADYDTVMLLAKDGHRLQRAKPAPVPRPEILRSINHKGEFSKLLSRLGVPQPPTEVARDAHELTNTALTFPIITKPPDRWASVGFQVHETPAKLQRTLSEGKLQAAFPLIVQELIPGWDAGFSFLARRGRVLMYSMFHHRSDGHRRFYDDQRLRQHACRVIEETGYDGVGHFDARYDPGKDAYSLLEINPRFWASLLYAMNAGVNYPKELAHLALRDESGDRENDAAADDGVPVTARHGDVQLPPYERALTLAVRLGERAYVEGYRFIRRERAA